MACKRILLYILAAYILLLLPACTKTEERAVWVVRFDLKTKENVKNIVRDAKAAGFTTIIAQVYGRADAYYDSYIVPRAEVLNDQPEDYDPLKTMIEECRKEGLKIHAWVNVYYIWQGVSADDPDTYPESEKHIVHTNPEWIIKDATGRRIDEYDSETRKLFWIEGLYADPSNLEYKEYFMSVCNELVTRYDVDGLHLDFVRYPGNSFGYNERAVTDYKNAYGVAPSDLSTSFSSPVPDKFITRELSLAARWEYYYHSLWIEHKSKYITSLVADLKREFGEKAGSKKIVLSAAVFPDKNSAYFAKSQDWGRWLKEGYLDMIMPMSYYGSKERVINQIYNVKKVAGDKKVLAGLGVYLKDDYEIRKEIHDLNKMNIDGFSFFSFGGMQPGAGYSKKFTNIKRVRRRIFTPLFRFDTKKKGLIEPPGFDRFGYIEGHMRLDLFEGEENRYFNLLKLAKRNDFGASHKEVNRFLGCIKKQFYSDDEFYEYLSRAGISKARLLDMLEDDITVFKFITDRVYPKIVIEPGEIVTIPRMADYQLMYRYVHPRDSAEKREKERGKINRIYSKLMRGGDFAALAKEYSRSATASDGGYYKNKFFDELDDVSNIIFSLKEGEMTKVLTRPSGFAVYKVNTLYDEQMMKYQDVSNEVKKLIFYNKLKDELSDLAQTL